MKKICWLMMVFLLCSSCKVMVEPAFEVEYIYVNNSGVEVAIVGKNKDDRYDDLPDSLVILDGASYSISSGFETASPYKTDVVKVYFNRETLVLHEKGSGLKGVRDIRDMFHFQFITTGELTQQAIYTFTPEDYQLALGLQENK